MEHRLYRKHSGGTIGTWRIWSESQVIHYAHAVVEGGSEQHNVEVVELNRSGRSMEEQVALQLAARLSRMKDKGYKDTRDEALKGSTNQLGLYNPMLAHPINKVTVQLSDDVPGHIQKKFDGHRCLTIKDGGEVTQYSRKGKPIVGIPHIHAAMQEILPEGMTVDGEIYRHGWTLQKIASRAKKLQPGSEELTYQVYDIVDTGVYTERINRLRGFMPIGLYNGIELTETTRVKTMEDVYYYFRQYRRAGYEGAMLRLDLRGYEDGVRSNQLLKVKEREDADFEVADVISGKNGVGILVLKLPNGLSFNCLAPGPVEEKQRILIQKGRYIGHRVSVEYACLTADGVPFHCVATRWVVEL